jgi:hypothetical protein
MNEELKGLFKLRSRQSRVADVVNGWRRQYGDEPSDPRWADVLRKLEKLDLNTTTPEEIDAIIGNTSWTTETCSICENETRDGWFEFETWGDRQIMCLTCAKTLKTITEAVA